MGGIHIDITFYNNNETVFNYRTCGVITDDKRILLHRMIYNDFWVLVGGRVQMLESSECAKREIKEELGVDIEISRLLWTVENSLNLETKITINFQQSILLIFQKNHG
ncbi:NUDIX domain-containing protein [Clostridium estertheticum]|uniref:NUDIX domain-containing protein n=1 Tax=Clostridium estertheticum TaxID=238834 RepID=UPI001CF3646A|nr:NUDIX domain-containing protein [Clostridium estertheticum]MCB2307410.1 NUDIX domain-containing protein [Clostridium estertheticum]MCB2345060.1 NUDIX domain-containing protein [Clostridium estertheticum]MCB2349780.1 NUDIX domain-containing protein [Clostridium estertheticum]WAG48096.1 NUDIX domain-containing protein [Clostridium estertheticum]